MDAMTETERMTPAEARVLEACAMNERGRDGLQERFRKLIDELRLCGLTIERYHTGDSRKSEPGFPDELILLPDAGRRIAAELKTEGAKPALAQARWLDAFAACGFEVYLWRPRHLLSGEIERILRGEYSPFVWVPDSVWWFEKYTENGTAPALVRRAVEVE